jgi:hypothetical protein
VLPARIRFWLALGVNGAQFAVGANGVFVDVSPEDVWETTNPEVIAHIVRSTAYEYESLASVLR